jgi:hypothetical protein
VELTSITVLLIRFLGKIFEPSKLKTHYKLLIKCLKNTSKLSIYIFFIYSSNKYFNILENNKIFNELINIWSYPQLDLNDDIKALLLPLLKKVIPTQ